MKCKVDTTHCLTMGCGPYFGVSDNSVEAETPSLPHRVEAFFQYRSLVHEPRQQRSPTHIERKGKEDRMIETLQDRVCRLWVGKVLGQRPPVIEACTLSYSFNIIIQNARLS